MKKYFFLLFLLFIYFILSSNSNDTKQVMTDKNFTNDRVYDITIDFKNGINSKILSETFSKYNYDYYINEISLDNEIIDVSCKKILVCIDEIFSLKDNNFYNEYVINGFKIKAINFIAYKDEVIPFLTNAKFDYTIK